MNELSETMEFVGDNLSELERGNKLFVLANILDGALRPLAEVAESAANEENAEKDAFLGLVERTVQLYKQYGKSNPLKEGDKFEAIKRAFPDDFGFDYRNMPSSGAQSFAACAERFDIT